MHSYESESDRSKFNLESCRALFSQAGDDWISVDTFINYCRANCPDARKFFGDLESKSDRFPGPEDFAQWLEWCKEQLTNSLTDKSDEEKTLLFVMAFTAGCMKIAKQRYIEMAVDRAWINASAEVIKRAVSDTDIVSYWYKMMNTNFDKEILLGVVRFITPEDAEEGIRFVHSGEQKVSIDPNDYKYYVIPRLSIEDPRQIEVTFMKRKTPLIDSLIINQSVNDSLENLWKISSENRNLFYGHLIGCRVNSEGIVTTQSTKTSESITLGCYDLALRSSPLERENPFFKELRALFAANSQDGGCV